MALRVVFADDNYLVRQGVTSLLTEVEDIDVVAVATDLASLLESVAETSPDVVLTDIRMPPTHTNEGIEAAKQIRSRHPGVGVVVLSQYVEEDYVFELLADGVAGLGYLLKERVTRPRRARPRAQGSGPRRFGARPRGRRDADRPPARARPAPRPDGPGA